VAKAILGMFQGRTARWACTDQHALRNAVPERRLTGYGIRDVIGLLADTGSFVELRREFGRCLVTGFVRLAGRPLGLLANDPQHLGGAIDADGADKAARFMQLCDAFGLPVLSLVDCPGFMVGPDSERAGAVRHGSRLFVTAASMSVPILTVVLRKAYGLGAQAMSGGSLHASRFTVSWPTGEFGAMGIEGAVTLAYRRELAANPERFGELVAQLYERGKALSVAQFAEIDAVIDPASTRDWVSGTLDGLPVARGPRRFVDTW
jgi:acetyl-CoA carboxylase carboxyltransferase component